MQNPGRRVCNGKEVGSLDWPNGGQIQWWTGAIKSEGEVEGGGKLSALAFDGVWRAIYVRCEEATNIR